jgi:type I restriction enzyme R subunit
MVEFKQIIGRGTRLYDGKDYFTIHDFTCSHELFKDPAWDGEELEPESGGGSTGGGGGRTGGGHTGGGGQGPEPPPPPPIIRIKLADGKERQFTATANSRASSATRNSCAPCGAYPIHARSCWRSLQRKVSPRPNCRNCRR